MSFVPLQYLGKNPSSDEPNSFFNGWRMKRPCVRPHFVCLVFWDSYPVSKLKLIPGIPSLPHAFDLLVFLRGESMKLPEVNFKTCSYKAFATCYKITNALLYFHLILQNTLCIAKLTIPHRSRGGIPEGEPQLTVTRPWMPSHASTAQRPLK